MRARLRPRTGSTGAVRRPDERVRGALDTAFQTRPADRWREIERHGDLAPRRAVGVYSPGRLRAMRARGQSLPRDFRLAIVHDGVVRSALVHRSEHHDAGRPSKTIVSFHGNGGTADYYRRYNRLDQVVDELTEHNLMAVHMEGTPNGWPLHGQSFNAGKFCCGTAGLVGTNDVGATDAMLDTLDDVFGLDAENIHLHGISNGGAMVDHLAGTLRNKVASIDMVVALHTGSERPDHPVSVHITNGTHDEIVLYDELTGGLAEATRLSSIVQPYHPVAMAQELKRVMLHPSQLGGLLQRYNPVSFTRDSVAAMSTAGKLAMSPLGAVAAPQVQDPATRNAVLMRVASGWTHGAVQSAEVWARHNGVAGPTRTERGDGDTERRVTPTAGGSEVALTTVRGGGHDLPGGTLHGGGSPDAILRNTRERLRWQLDHPLAQGAHGQSATVDRSHATGAR